MTEVSDVDAACMRQRKCGSACRRLIKNGRCIGG